jgi:DNA-binding response OmpR family regulator
MENLEPTDKPRILWIEDDLRYAKLLQLELGHLFEFKVLKRFEEEGSEQLKTNPSFDAVMIDMHLGEGRRGELEFQALRAAGYEGPVFILSNDETVISKLQMLSLGVDDYLWKVMPTQELELRLNNVIQRYRKKFRSAAATPTPPRANHREHSLDGLEIQVDRLTASLNQKPLELSKIEFKLLLVILKNHPKPTHLPLLKEEVWGPGSVESGTISTFVWKLNKKTQGWGYRIVRSGDEILLRTDSAPTRT